MIYLKTDPVGVDTAINLWIERFNKQLIQKKGWGLNIYHKLYREKIDNAIVPHAFLSDIEYREVFINDSIDGEVGFLLSPVREQMEGFKYKTEMDIIFSVNLDRLDDTSKREDEKAMMAALNVITGYTQVKSIKTTLEEVFRGFDTKRIIYKDMQPFFNFSFTIDLILKTQCNEL